MATLPSVARLANPDVLSAFNIPSVKTMVAAMDAALERFADSKESVVEVPPSVFFLQAGGFGRDAFFVVNLLRSGFVELCGRRDDGTVVSGAEFARLFSAAARAKSSGLPIEDTEVFYRVDIAMLREAANNLEFIASQETTEAGTKRARRSFP